MIFHIFPDEKFTLDFIQRTESLFDISEHSFWIYGCQYTRKNWKEHYSDYINKTNFIFSEYNRNTIKVFEEKLEKADIIIVHGLFNSKMLLSINKYIKKKDKIFVWLIWGADLYNAYDFHHSLRVLLHPKAIIAELLRMQFIKHVQYVSACDGDYRVLKNRYKTNAKLLHAIYSYDVVNVQKVTDDKSSEDYNSKHKHEHKLARVLVGHSATETCRHIETFKKLSKFKDKICVVCPLSYPENNETYTSDVIKSGKEIFGEHFEPITDFMPYEKYINFLNSIDVGVFNNNRQQGHGNIINLILLGKKVYMSEDNTIKEIYSPENGYYTFKVEDIDETMLQPLTAEQKEYNRKKVLYLLSDDYFKEKWSIIYNLRS